MKYGDAIRRIAERTGFASEEEQREVLAAIDKQHAPRGAKQPDPEPEPEPAK